MYMHHMMCLHLLLFPVAEQDVRSHPVEWPLCVCVCVCVCLREGLFGSECLAQGVATSANC